MATQTFQPADRKQTSLLADLEKRALLWLARRMPRKVNSDHLTLLGFFAMIGAGASYWLASRNSIGLLLVIVCLAVNWFGDSLDGTLARVRNQQRPRYGFYVDHVLDALGSFFLLLGLAFSGYMSPVIAIGLLIAYLLLQVEVYLATYTLGKFQMSYGAFSPTELRLLLVIGNIALFYRPIVRLFDYQLRLFDVGGAIGIAGMALILVTSIARHTARLYKEEPLK